MPVKVFRSRKFSTTHENKIFDELIEKLRQNWENSDQLIVLLGNFFCSGTEVDALIVKNDSISVLDFKDYGGEITFSENSEWKANKKAIKFDSGKNPFLQIQHNKFAILNFLNEKQLFNKGNIVNLGHISGIVMFHQKIQFDNISIPKKVSSWFHVTDIFNITNLLNNITSREIILRKEEIERFADVFELNEYVPEKPIINVNENEFKNKKEFIDEFSILIDIQVGIDIAQVEWDKMIERHNEFIRFFYPKKGPEEQLNYNLNHYYNNYKTKQKEFIDIQKNKLNKQIETIYNLNTNNGFIINEFTNGKDLKESLLNKAESIRIINKIQQKFKIKYASNIIGKSALEAYTVFFYERGIFDEFTMKRLEKEFIKKDLLLNNLHAIYVICRLWFADDMIKHGLEKEIGEVEHVYARGFSGKWKINIEKKLNDGKPLSISSEIRLFLNEQQEIDLNKFPQKSDAYSSYSEEVITNIEIPEIIQSIFTDIVGNLKEILTNDELNIILAFFNINWIKKNSISIDDIIVIDLKTHILFHLGNDFDFLANKNSPPFHYLPNQTVYEPFYLTLFEESGIKLLDKFDSNDEFKNSYKTLPQHQVKKIAGIINAWEIYKSLRWYYTYDDYYFNNKLNIGSRDNGVDYKGTNVSKELLISQKQLEDFLNDIKNYRFYGNFYYTGIGDRYYIQALKYFKRLSHKEKDANKMLRHSLKNSESFKNNINQPRTTKQDEQPIIGYIDIKKYIEQRLESYLNPDDAIQFGLKKTAGILLYGPPGCGKTYWANWISKYLNLAFEEVFRSHIGSIYVDGAMNELDKKLNEIEKKAPIAIFFDEFDSIGKARESNSASGDESRKVVNTLLQRIPKLIKKGIVVLAATNFINDLDSAAIRPGRFDLHIPIFPPLPAERAEMLLYNLTADSPTAILEILTNNHADEIDYWYRFTDIMYLFSNSHVIDFCNELKGLLYIESRNTEIAEIILSDDHIISTINTVKSKIRKKDVELYIKFFQESMNLLETFSNRMERLRFEIDTFVGKGDKEYRPIGFKPNK